MKKYVKPDLYYENFELSQHVATCAWDMSNFRSKEECTAIADPTIDGSAASGFELVTLFVGDNDKCNFDQDSDDLEIYCWTNGTLTNNVFNS